MKALKPSAPKSKELDRQLEEEKRKKRELELAQERERNRVARGLVGVRSLLSSGPGGFLQ